MSMEYGIEQRDGYSVVRASGEPTLGQFLSFLQVIAVETRTWPVNRALFDLRGVRSLTTFTEHYAVGQAVVRELAHLQRIASVVPADRITRASEKTARQGGVDLRVFTDEGEAIAWLAGRGT